MLPAINLHVSASFAIHRFKKSFAGFKANRGTLVEHDRRTGFRVTHRSAGTYR